MNVILVLIDSLNRNLLAPFGGQAEWAPNIAEFAKRSLRFDNHYVGSLPCMPARREIYSGRKDFLWRPWGHLEAFDRALPREIRRAGLKTQLITDHYHYWEEGAHGYLESFQGVEMIRGHELDPWRTDPVSEVPKWVEAIERFRPGQGKLYYRNVRDFRTEEDFFPAKVFSSASSWIQQNYGHEPFFLQVESFDVHEPFHCPEPYRSMWTDAVRDDLNCWPPYQDTQALRTFFRQTTPEELAFIRSQYLGKLTMVDRWLGSFLATLEAHDVYKDTVVIVTTDHGHDLGQRQAFGKQFPHWDSHANIPLFIRHPSCPASAGQAAQSLTSTVDLYATVLDAAGAVDVPRPHSRSLLPLLENTHATVRDSVLYGTFSAGACCSDGEYVLMQGYDNDTHPLWSYTGRLQATATPEQIQAGHWIPGVDYPLWRTPVRVRGSHPSILVDRADSAGRNLLESEPAVRRRMEECLVHLMESEGCPPEQFARLGLRR